MGSYLIVLHAKTPSVTKTFELTLSRSKTVNKVLVDRKLYSPSYQLISKLHKTEGHIYESLSQQAHIQNFNKRSPTTDIQRAHTGSQQG